MESRGRGHEAGGAERGGCRCIVACDATKFGKTAFGRICPVERADVIVTDAAIPAGQRTAFTAPMCN